MAVTTVETFSAVSTNNVAIMFEGESASEQIQCVGTISGETEIQEIAKLCGGVEIDKIAKPLKMNMTLTAHVPLPVYRKFFGLEEDAVKFVEGVQHYGRNSKAKNFSFVADIVDDFEDVVKMIGLPKCSSTTGLSFTVENGADEVAQLELEFTALMDAEGNFYYELATPETSDATIISKWHTNFSTATVLKTAP